MLENSLWHKICTSEPERITLLLTFSSTAVQSRPPVQVTWRPQTPAERSQGLLLMTRLKKKNFSSRSAPEFGVDVILRKSSQTMAEWHLMEKTDTNREKTETVWGNNELLNITVSWHLRCHRQSLVLKAIRSSFLFRARDPEMDHEPIWTRTTNSKLRSFTRRANNVLDVHTEISVTAL